MREKRGFDNEGVDFVRLEEKGYAEVLGEQYAAIRRTRGDGNCFFRSFMFSYLEHILESQDQSEVDRIKANVEQCRKTLQSLGYADFTFEDFFALFLEQLDSVLQGNEASISHDELILRSRDQSVSDYVVMFFRFVTSGEIRKRAEFFEPFILGLTNATVEQFCKSSVEPMGEESDHVHITALSDALGVPIRVVYLDRSSCDTGGVSVNHHDFVPAGSDLPNASGGSEKAIGNVRVSDRDKMNVLAKSWPLATVAYMSGWLWVDPTLQELIAC
ncbi:hypothetical protein GBA52_003519 [Prunus armeniaca]|nr:hypothetical protein GBA52_003519 [Prunus armeniaca]